MKKIIILFFLLLGTNANSQLKARIANAHFEQMEYAMCSDMYDELADKFLRSSSKSDQEWEYVRRAALSHYHIFDMTTSIGYYEQLKINNRLTESDREYFLKALRYNGKYEEAYKLALESSNLHKNNLYFKEMVDNNSKQNKLLEDSLRYRLFVQDANSGLGDFAPSYWNKNIVYATKSSNTKAINPTYGWDDSYYINLKQSPLLTDSTFGEGTVLKQAFITKAHDGPVSFNSTGDKMVLTRNAVEKVKGTDIIHLSLYFSELKNGVWTEPQAFTFNDPDFNTGHAVFAENDKALYFVSDKPGGQGNADIYVSRLDYYGNWSEPINLGNGINTSQDELFPFVYEDKLYFASNGHFGMGGLDIFEHTLGIGSTPKNLGYPVNTSHDDFGLIVDSTEYTGFMTSNRGDNIDRIYSYKRIPITIDLQGIVYATYSEKESIPNHPVVITNESTGITDTLITNEFGQFLTRLQKGDNYKITTSKEEFILVKDGFVSTAGVTKDSVFYCELPLRPTTLQVRLRVLEMGTGKTIAYAKTTVTDYALNKESVLHTDENGMVTIKVDRNKTYWAHASKKGFIDDNIAFNSANENDKVIDLELKLPPIVKGDVFKLENIFYDLNKSSLRPESKLALDKLADFIIKNEVKIELSSHTDARGSDSYNLKLSQARAQSCVDYLISKGVRKNQIIAKGYGETKLINRCKNGIECPEDLHQENRRTEVKIL